MVAADERLASTLENPAPWRGGGSPAALLAALRRSGAVNAELVMPVPGGVRGLGGASQFSSEALRAGEAVVLNGLGIVPERLGSAIDGGIVRWTVFEVDRTVPTPDVPIGEAEHELTGAMRVAAGMLIELGVALIAADRASGLPSRCGTGVRADALQRCGNPDDWPLRIHPPHILTPQRASGSQEAYVGRHSDACRCHPVSYTALDLRECYLTQGGL